MLFLLNKTQNSLKVAGFTSKMLENLYLVNLAFTYKMLENLMSNETLNFPTSNM